MPQVNEFQSTVLSFIGGLFLFLGFGSIIWTLLSVFQEPVMVNHHMLLLPYAGALTIVLGVAIGRVE